MWSVECGVWGLGVGSWKRFRVGRGLKVSGGSGFQGFRVPFEDGESGDWDEL